MANKGYISLYRDIQDNFLWNSNEQFSRGQAWIDLLLSANHKDTKFMYQGKLIPIKKGQFLTSLEKLSRRWNWGKHKTLDFLKMLEAENMIIRDSGTLNGTLVTIVNYEKYQKNGNSKGNTHSTTDSTTHSTTNSTTDSPQTIMKNNVNNENKYIEPSAPVDEMTDEEWWAWANSEEADNDSV